MLSLFDNITILMISYLKVLFFYYFNYALTIDISILTNFQRTWRRVGMSANSKISKYD